MTIYLPHVSGGNDARPTFDMVDYMAPPQSLIFEMQLIDRDGKQHQARHQCQYTAGDGARMHWYLTKGDEVRAEYEELFADVDPAGFIYRGYDTSPGNGEYYVLMEMGDGGPVLRSRWCPRRWSPGDVYERNPFVAFHRKADCGYIPEKSGYHRTWLRFDQHLESWWHEDIGTIEDVIMLEWITQLGGPTQPEVVEETYLFARNMGMIAWSGAIGGAHIVEIHEPGERPDNRREVIPCL